MRQTKKPLEKQKDFESSGDNLNREFFRDTIRYMKNTSIDYRKSKGQYFTPKTIREKLLGKLPSNKSNPTVLDPGCGTGEFLDTASKYFKNPKLFGWDIEKELIDIAERLVPQANLKVINTLKVDTNEKFDFVIGNPPYYEFRPDKTIKKRFKEVINGRVNIFALFIKLGLDLLKKGGYLAYVLPPSMNNGAYFARLRNYIIHYSNIEYLSILQNAELFHDALQSTMLLILKKGPNKKNYLFKKNGITIFTERPEYLEEAFHHKLTLRDLGFAVKTGRIVWNQNKHLLTKDSNKGIPLIWSSNITSRGLKLPIRNKPQYISVDNYDVGPAIVVNRITGTVRSAQLRAAIIPEGMEFIAENHVNVIYPPEKDKQLRIKFQGEKRKKLSLEEVAGQLNSDEKIKLLQYITGNTQISKNELENLFPINP